MTAPIALLLTFGLSALALPFVWPSLYLGALAILARRGTAPAPDRSTPICVVVPAHDEAAGIAATVASLRAVDYPDGMFEILVIADNCTDRTAERARAAGARVLERQDATRRGKGFALEYAYDEVLRAGWARAVVVVDADTIVTPNLLTGLSARFAAGADAVQAEYMVRNPDDSWRTRLLHLAYSLFHTVRSLGRERLGVSCGLRGNGMGFSTELLRRVPAKAYSLVEDLEYGIALGRAGVRIVYAEECTVFGEMPATAVASASQRLRWEGGRRSLRKSTGWPLLRAGLVARDALLLDLALDLLVPPISRLAVAIGAGTLLAVVAWGAGAGPSALLVWSIGLASLAIYLARGVQYAQVGPRLILDVAYAPAYVLWSLWTTRRRAPGAGAAWVRTTRNERPEETRHD